MYSPDLPNVGDIITFCGVWHSSLSDTKDGAFPNGVVTSIVKYDSIAIGKKDKDFIGTLAYPITINNAYVENSRVFIVQWATASSHIREGYRLINEEWFYNKSFRIISRA